MNETYEESKPKEIDDASKLIEDWLDCHAQDLDVQRGLPATDADVARLESEAGFSFRRDHVAFLKRVGAVRFRAKHRPEVFAVLGHAPNDEELDMFRIRRRLKMEVEERLKENLLGVSSLRPKFEGVPLLLIPERAMMLTANGDRLWLFRGRLSRVGDGSLYEPFKNLVMDAEHSLSLPPSTT